MKLEKLYVQSNCLQGEAFSTYMLWPKDVELSIEIEVPEELSIKGVNNAKMTKTGSGTFIAEDIKNNGYLSIIFETASLEKNAVDVELTFNIRDAQGNLELQKRQIHLFRPEFEISEMPKRIVVKKDDRGRISLDNTVVFRNNGEGLAIISFDTSEDSEMDITEPLEIKVFSENFAKDFGGYMEDVKKSYTDYVTQIDSFVELFSEKMKLTNENLKRLKRITDDITDILTSDPGFQETFVSSLFNAFYRNANIITEFETFINYIKSIDSRRVTLLNPVGIVSVGMEAKRFKGNINVLDMGFNLYPPVPFEIEIRSESGDINIPLYRLFMGME